MLTPGAGSELAWTTWTPLSSPSTSILVLSVTTFLHLSIMSMVVEWTPDSLQVTA